MFPARIKLVVLVALAAILIESAYALHPNAPATTKEAVRRVSDRLAAEQSKFRDPTRIMGIWQAPSCTSR